MNRLSSNHAIALERFQLVSKVYAMCLGINHFLSSLISNFICIILEGNFSKVFMGLRHLLQYLGSKDKHFLNSFSFKKEPY
jgi:hypothetical protein